MTLTPFYRKLWLSAHIIFSVGWLGAVAGFLVLAIAGLTSPDQQLVRSCYLSMDLVAWFVIVPSCFASLISGIIQALGTPWGLFRHYWVLVKFLLTIAATIILLLHMQPISYMADIASERMLLDSKLQGLRIQLVADAGAALLVLLITIILSVYKPWGKTGYGKQNQQPKQIKSSAELLAKNKSGGVYVILGLVCLALLFIIFHLAGGGFGHH